jgi:transposase-like protein
MELSLANEALMSQNHRQGQTDARGTGTARRAGEHESSACHNNGYNKVRRGRIGGHGGGTAMKTEFKGLYDLFEAIPDEQAAIDYFTAIRWKHGEYCAHCGSTRVYHFSDNRTHKCADCHRQFSIKIGTVFEGTKIPIRKWLATIWIITSHKKGIASAQLARDFGVPQKTAWFMLQRLRYAARTGSFNRRLKGDI